MLWQTTGWRNDEKQNAGKYATALSLNDGNLADDTRHASSLPVMYPLHNIKCYDGDIFAE